MPRKRFFEEKSHEPLGNKAVATDRPIAQVNSAIALHEYGDLSSTECCVERAIAALAKTKTVAVIDKTMPIVERLLAVLGTGSCYAERKQAIKQLEERHNQLWLEEQAVEEALWRAELTDLDFNTAWEMLEDKVDGFGGHECRRVYCAWLLSGKPSNIKQFILETV